MMWEREIEVARAAARRAGELALGYQRAGVAREIKADRSPVTIADKESERLLVSELSAAFPDDGFLGEEGASREGASGSIDLWVEPTAKPWDLAPLQVILEESGALAFDFNGEATIYGGNCIACVPGPEPAARELIGKARSATSRG
jgi:fructose-1,6-bisphosphatase/inositol monophosphatase family enzyme